MISFIIAYQKGAKRKKLMPKKFLTVKEVAKILAVTPLTVRNWDRKGRLSAYRHPVNNYRLYKITEVEDLMRELEGSKGKKVVLAVAPPNIRKLEIGED